MEKETPRTTKRRDIASKRQEYFERQEIRTIPPHSPDSLHSNPSRKSLEANADDLNTSRTYTVESISEREQREREIFESSLNDRMSLLRSCTPERKITDSFKEGQAVSSDEDIILLTHRPEESVGLVRVVAKPGIREDVHEEKQCSDKSFTNVENVDELVNGKLTNGREQSPEELESVRISNKSQENVDDRYFEEENDDKVNFDAEIAIVGGVNRAQSTNCSTPRLISNDQALTPEQSDLITECPANAPQETEEEIVAENNDDLIELLVKKEEYLPSNNSATLENEIPLVMNTHRADDQTCQRLKSAPSKADEQGQDSPRSFASVDNIDDLLEQTEEIVNTARRSSEIDVSASKQSTPLASSNRDPQELNHLEEEFLSEALSSRPVSQASVKNYRELVSARDHLENNQNEGDLHQPQSLSFLSPTSSISLNIENNSDVTIKKLSSSSTSSSSSSSSSSNSSQKSQRTARSKIFDEVDPEHHDDLSERAETLSLRDLAPNSPIMFTMPVKTLPNDEMDENLRAILEKSNSILQQSHLLMNEAQVKLTEEDSKSPRGQKLVPVLYGKRKESDLLESHRGNFSRHWEHAAPSLNDVPPEILLRIASYLPINFTVSTFAVLSSHFLFLSDTFVHRRLHFIKRLPETDEHIDFQNLEELKLENLWGCLWPLRYLQMSSCLTTLELSKCRLLFDDFLFFIKHEQSQLVSLSIHQVELEFVTNSEEFEFFRQASLDDQVCCLRLKSLSVSGLEVLRARLWRQHINNAIAAKIFSPNYSDDLKLIWLDMTKRSYKLIRAYHVNTFLLSEYPNELSIININSLVMGIEPELSAGRMSDKLGEFLSSPVAHERLQELYINTFHKNPLLMMALSKMRNLTVLDVEMCKLTDADLVLLPESLIALNLSQNKITSAGLKLLRSRSLKDLDVSRTNICAKAFDFFLEAQKNLRFIDLSKVIIEETLETLNSYLVKSRSIKCIVLSNPEDVVVEMIESYNVKLLNEGRFMLSILERRELFSNFAFTPYI